MSLLTRATSGGRQNNRLLAMEGERAQGRLSTTPTQGATGINSGRHAGAGQGNTIVDAYLHGIDHEWSRRTGQPLTHSHAGSTPRRNGGNGRAVRRLL